MKTLSEIKRNIISYYSRIQNRITDFAVGSVAHDIIFSFSAAMEDVYRELATVEKQAYVATATGEYLDKLIAGTFQLKRAPATRSTGYVVVYADSPIVSPEAVKLRYADFNYATGEILGGLQSSVKFIGYNEQGDEGIVYTLINPRNLAAVKPTDRLIDLGNRNVQYLILPVASVLTGAKVNVREGGITSFPAPPPGLAKVINTSNPGAIFFTAGQAISSVPFYTRFTEALNYHEGVIQVVNAYAFSERGHIEITRDISERPLTAIYSDKPLNDQAGAKTMSGGLIFEYIERDTSFLKLKSPILSGSVPTVQVNDAGVLKTLALRRFTYDGVDYDEGSTYLQDIHNFMVTKSAGLIVAQRRTQITDSLIFDPDSVLSEEYRILPSNMVGGGVDAATDDEYRVALTKYLSSLSKATQPALEAGALQVPGITFAKTLSGNVTPRGSTILLVSNSEGVVSGAKKLEVRSVLDQSWKAAGVNLIVISPELVNVNVSMIVKLTPGAVTSAVYNQLVSAISAHLALKNPGESIRYSDLLSVASSIPSVENVFNLLILKNLTYSTYNDYKAEYDLAALLSLGDEYRVFDQSGGGALTVGGAVKYQGNDNMQPLEDDPGGPSSPDAVGVVFDSDGTDYGVILGNVPKVHALYSQLTGLVATPGDFIEAVSAYNDDIQAAGKNFLYVASYLFSEPLTEIPTNYPVNPQTIEYQFVSDYMATQTQVFRMNKIKLDQTALVPLLGVQFIQ